MAAVASIAMLSAGELFTRGGPDMPEKRGESMVQKHMDMLRKEKENNALVAVRDAFPDLGAAVCIVALEASDWDVEAAVHLLDAFHTVKGPQLETLAQEHKRRHAERGDQEVDAAAPIPESRPESGIKDGSDDSGSDSESDHRRSKKRHRDKESSKHSKHKRAKKEERESKKHSKRGKGDRKESKWKSSLGRDAVGAKKDKGEKGPVTNQFGAHGVIREGDLGAKRGEFQAWAIETQNVDIEILGKAEEKELFRTYVEDFNTSTLPHRKYYNLEFYHQEKAARARKKGHSMEEEEKTVFDDEAEVRRERAAKRAMEEAERLKDAYNALKYTDTGKAEDMREQQLMRLQMRQAYRTGDHATADRLANKLKPDDPRLEAPTRPNF